MTMNMVIVNVVARRRSVLSNIRKIWNAPSRIVKLRDQQDELESRIDTLEDSSELDDRVDDLEQKLEDLDVPDGEEIDRQLTDVQDKLDDNEKDISSLEDRVDGLEAEHVDTKWARATMDRLNHLEASATAQQLVIEEQQRMFNALYRQHKHLERGAFLGERRHVELLERFANLEGRLDMNSSNIIGHHDRLAIIEQKLG